MARVFINHPVADYDKWRPVFDADKARRAASGVTDVAVLRDTADPNSIWIVAEADAAQVEALLGDPELGKLMQEAGVTAPTPALGGLKPARKAAGPENLKMAGYPAD